MPSCLVFRCVARYPPGFGMRVLNSSVTLCLQGFYPNCLGYASLKTWKCKKNIPFQPHKTWNSDLMTVQLLLFHVSKEQISSQLHVSFAPLGWHTITVVIKSNWTSPKECFQLDQTAYPALCEQEHPFLCISSSAKGDGRLSGCIP